MPAKIVLETFAPLVEHSHNWPASVVVNEARVVEFFNFPSVSFWSTTCIVSNNALLNKKRLWNKIWLIRTLNFYFPYQVYVFSEVICFWRWEWTCGYVALLQRLDCKSKKLNLIRTPNFSFIISISIIQHIQPLTFNFLFVVSGFKVWSHHSSVV